jgi:hypothetical protein
VPLLQSFRMGLLVSGMVAVNCIPRRQLAPLLCHLWKVCRLRAHSYITYTIADLFGIPLARELTSYEHSDFLLQYRRADLLMFELSLLSLLSL